MCLIIGLSNRDNNSALRAYHWMLWMSTRYDNNSALRASNLARIEELTRKLRALRAQFGHSPHIGPANDDMPLNASLAYFFAHVTQ